MTAVLQFDGVAQARLPAGPVHLAIGMFDGVHLGHRAVIEPAIRAARAEKGVAAVLTFWPHPSALFRPNDPTRLIQTPHAKAEVLGRLGVDAVITERFTPEFARIPADQFLGWLKQQLPALMAVYVGENFRFGHKRQGTAATLAASGEALGIKVSSAPRITAHGESVSSTRIRAHLEAGEIEAANALLGYPYFADGVVVSGKKLGRGIGFPTLNLPWSPDLKPRYGVYAVRVTGAAKPEFTVPGSPFTGGPRGSVEAGLVGPGTGVGARVPTRPELTGDLGAQGGAAPGTQAGSGQPAPPCSVPGVANYGVRPTVENTTEPKLEIHVLGSCPFDAGDEITVEWLHFIRPEMKFAGIGELRAQIARDRDAATAALG